MSIQNFLISALLKMRQRSNMQLSTEHRLRRNRKFMATDRRKPDRSVSVQADVLAGLPVEWITPAQMQGARPPATCVYFHGGAFVMGGLNSHRDMAISLAKKADIQMLMVDYRLAPEHPFPAALDDAMAVYRALVARGLTKQPLFIGGDSAGGNIALATVQAIRDEGLPQPKAFFLFSPWLDLQNDGPSYRSNAMKDVMLNRQLLDEAVALYAPGTPVAHVRLSPLLGSVSGLPPCLIVASRTEILLDDAMRLGQNIHAQGGRAECLEWANTPHAFPVLSRYLPEARAALDQTARFIRQHLSH